jgi:protocatechuate 3,4-dioxygenase beta subunit
LTPTEAATGGYVKSTRISRRDMLENCIVKGMLLAGAAATSQSTLLAWWQRSEQSARQPTPAEVLGPFYKKGAPNVRVLRQAGDAGFPLRVSGKVMNTRGEAVPNAAVDFWQTDFYGHYDLKGFKYRAKIRPDEDGSYSVETIMPGHYPDRPAQHIHYLIAAPGHRPLVTQAYFATDPYFDGDSRKNYAKGGIVQNMETVRPVTLFGGDGGGLAAITFDIVLEVA